MNKNVSISRRVINHVRRHKIKYITGGACLVIGGIGGIIGAYVSTHKNLFSTHSVEDGIVDSIATNVENGIIDLIGRNGHPGNVIYCNETKQIFKSHREACRELGLDNRDLWAYIKHIKPTARGFTFKSVGEASNGIF